MASTVTPSRTGDPVVDRNFRELAALVNAIPIPGTFQATSVVKNYSASGFEGVIHVDASRGPVRVTLPAPSDLNPPLTIKQVNPAGKFNAVTVVASGGQKVIAGASSFALDTSGMGTVTFTSDGVQHWPDAGTGGNAAAAPPVSPGSQQGSSSPSVLLQALPPVFLAGNQIGLAFDLTLLQSQGALGRATITGDVSIPQGSNVATIQSLSALAGSGIVDVTQPGSVLGVATIGTGLVYSSGTIDVANPAGATSTFGGAGKYLQAFTVDGYGKVQSATAVSGPLLQTINYFPSGIQPGGLSGWLATSLVSVVGGGTVVEYPLGIAATTWTLSINVITNTITPGAGNSQFYASINGSIFGPVIVPNGTTGTFTSGAITVTGAISDTWGVKASGTAPTGGTLAAAVTLTVTH